MGVELLRKMGWKEGQGVGPRVKRKAAKQKSGESSFYRNSTCVLMACADLIVGTPGLETLTFRVPVMYLSHKATGCP